MSIRFPRFLLTIVSALLLGSAVSVWFVGSSSSLTQAGPSVIYLADAAQPGINSAEARARGMHVVTTVLDLEAAKATAEAIVIDKSQIDRLPLDLLATEYRRGRVIAGVNVSLNELVQRTRGEQPDRPDSFIQDWGGRSFYSVVYQSAAGSNPSYKGWTSDQLTNTSVFMAVIRRSVQASNGVVE